MASFNLKQSKKPISATFLPNASGCTIQLSRAGASSNYLCVDDTVGSPDDDGSYVYNSSPTTYYDMYNIPNHTTESGTINYVRVDSRVKSYLYGQSQSGVYKLLISDNACSNIYKSDDKDLTTSYQNQFKIWTDNPRTSNAWTWSDIDNLQIGVECSSPSITLNGLTETLWPDGDDTKQWANPTLPHYTNVNSVDTSSKIFSFIDGTGDNYDLFDLSNHSESGTAINSITVFAYVKYGTAATLKLMIETGGVIYYGDDESTDGYEKKLISYTWSNNPNTGSAWTYTDIDALKAGIYHYNTTGSCSPYCYTVSCYYLYVIINYDDTVNPEIRTTQEYATVNYTPPESTCTLTLPEEISVNHTRNINMINFWNGDREVYSISRSSKTMVLRGIEYSSDSTPCDRITCVRDMGLDGSTVTVSGLGNCNYDGEYRIRSFGWKKRSEKPLVFDWILELESATL
jgi:hypothetical protein